MVTSTEETFNGKLHFLSSMSVTISFFFALLLLSRSCHCRKIIQIRSFSSPYFFAFVLNTGKYGPEKLRILTLFMQCVPIEIIQILLITYYEKLENGNSLSVSLRKKCLNTECFLFCTFPYRKRKFQKSFPELLWKKDILNHFKHIWRSLFSNRVAGCRPVTLLKRVSRAGIFLWILR